MVTVVAGLALANIVGGLLLLAILPSFRRAVLRRCQTCGGRGYLDLSIGRRPCPTCRHSRRRA